MQLLKKDEERLLLCEAFDLGEFRWEHDAPNA
jgi:hypothetical protein